MESSSEDQRGLKVEEGEYGGVCMYWWCGGSDDEKGKGNREACGFGFLG